MRISGNELCVTVTKACVGAGVPRGVAEDMGQACLHIALSGEDILPDMLNALRGFAATPAMPRWRKVGQEWLADEICCLPHGPSMVDFAHLALALGSDGQARAERVDFPLLIRGLAMADGHEFSTGVDGDGLWLRMSDERRARPAVRSDALLVEETEWAQLVAFAELIMVPADDSNLSDAGAGTTDND